MGDDDWSSAFSAYITSNSTLDTIYSSTVRNDNTKKQLSETQDMLRKAANGWHVFDLATAVRTPTREEITAIVSETEAAYEELPNFICFNKAEAATLFKTLFY